MASLDYRLNPLFTIKECSSCGSLYNKGYCCIPDSSQQPLRDCPKCGNPVEGPNCQGCALWRKKLKEVWFTICHENGIYQDLLNTYESSDDDTNVVNAPREPFVVKQDPGVNSSQSPPQIDHHCCYECGDSLNDIFCQRCTYRYWKIPICYDDDEDYIIAITPVLSTKEPVDSLIIEDDHLDAIPTTESGKVINSSVENLVPIPSESEGIPDSVCDVPLCNNPTPLEAFKEHSEIVVDFNDDSTSMMTVIIRSDFYHEEFVDELAHIISPPEYDCFYFKSEAGLGELTSIVDSGIRENVLPTTNVNLPFEDAQSPLLAYVVWIFLFFLTYPVTPPYLLSCGNEDTIFDPGISVYQFLCRVYLIGVELS
ncbi:hypothetical protein Tco_0173379 [Tanacetum coccineum]